MSLTLAQARVIIDAALAKGRADAAQLGASLGWGETDAESVNRFELVQRPARVTEAAAAHLAERNAACSDDRADREAKANELIELLNRALR